jgi:hypothetical protein
MAPVTFVEIVSENAQSHPKLVPFWFVAARASTGKSPHDREKTGFQGCTMTSEASLVTLFALKQGLDPPLCAVTTLTACLGFVGSRCLCV